VKRIRDSFAFIGKDGRTPAVSPKHAALAYRGRLRQQGRYTNLKIDGAEYTVESPGLKTLIFVPLED
jgi:hypothetical protein